MNSCNDCKYPKCCKVGILAALTMAVSSTLYYGYNLYLKRTQTKPKEPMSDIKSENDENKTQ